MNRVWVGETKPNVTEYECSRCHRRVYVTAAGYLPIHRHKGKRQRCAASESDARFHRKIG